MEHGIKIVSCTFDAESWQSLQKILSDVAILGGEVIADGVVINDLKGKDFWPVPQDEDASTNHH